MILPRRRYWSTPCSTASSRKLVLTAARNGYYFTLDRVTGERLVTTKWGSLTNWADGLNKFGVTEVRS